MTDEIDKFAVPGPDGTIICRLNEALAKRQGVTDEQLRALIVTHQIRYLVREVAYLHLPNTLVLKSLARILDSVEAEQQRLWNFEVDASYRRFWEMPGCSCPKMDNAERVGTPYTIINQGCQIHGNDAPVVIKDKVPDLVKALALYADPAFYHAVSIIGDRPTGGFDEDVSMVDAEYGYDRPMPGKHARDALTKAGWLTEDRGPEDLHTEE